MIVVAKTDIGKIRSSNQDSYNTGVFSGGVVWAVVCDGMGGANGGNVASTTAVKMISEKITSCYYDGMSGNSIRNMLYSAIETANACVFDMAQSNEELYGMGTTVIATIITGDLLYIAHAGDSRAYLFSDNNMYQLTTDHSVVQVMVERGQITQDEARVHPRKNIITRALGVDKQLDVDFCEESFKKGDILVICTDGLTNFADTESIIGVIRETNYNDFADKLVKLANDNGGGDNITVVAIAND